jgi:putative hemolysin
MCLRLKEEEEKITEENIKLLVKRGRESGTINVVEEEMIENVFEFDETLVRAIMTPVESFFEMDIETFDESMFFESHFSRVPVKENSEYIGILHLKDYVNRGDLSLRDVIRPLHVVNSHHPIDVLFLEMQRLNEHMRIVVNDHNKVVGLVTFEDLVEEVFGPIYDEYSAKFVDEIEEVSENVFRMSGKLSIPLFNETFSTKLYSESVFTIGEYLKERIGKIPRNGDHFHFHLEDLEFEIVTVRHKEIVTIEFRRK